MILSDSFYSVENRARCRINQRLQELELTSDSEDNGLEHYMSREEFDQLATHNYDIGVFWSRKFAKKLTKKIIVKLWEVSYFFDDEQLQGMILSFITENELKYHIQDDPAIAAEFASKIYFQLAFQDKLWKSPQYLSNIIENKYTLSNNEEHLDIFEILKNLNLHYGIRKIAKAKKPQRHKGYRDHGSLSDETSRVLKEEWKNDYSNYEIQQKEEESQKELEDTIEFIKGFLM